MLDRKGNSRPSGRNLNGNRFLIIGRNPNGFALFQIRLLVASNRDGRYEKPIRTIYDVHQYFRRFSRDC